MRHCTVCRTVSLDALADARMVYFSDRCAVSFSTMADATRPARLWTMGLLGLDLIAGTGVEPVNAE